MILNRRERTRLQSLMDAAELVETPESELAILRTALTEVLEDEILVDPFADRIYALAQSNKIAAIKEVRHVKEWGLRKAKEYVDDLIDDKRGQITGSTNLIGR